MNSEREEREEVRVRAAFQAAWEFVYPIAIHAHRLGSRIVQINPKIVLPSRALREGYGDDFDLRVFKLGELDWKRLEVKGKRFSFTSAADFPHSTILLDRTDKTDRCLVDGFQIVSNDCQYAAYVPASTRREWREVTVPDSTRGYPFIGYECPKALATFMRIAA
jgi:hypothetical protein